MCNRLGLAGFCLVLLFQSGMVFPRVWGDDLSLPGPYAVGTATVTVTRPNNSTFTALLYYPATTEGADAPLADADNPFSAITFGHGFLQNPNRYFGTMSHLASYGHIVIASNSEQGLFPSHSNFASDMRHTLSYLTNRNSNPVDTFFGKVDTNNYGLFGHSMGGGAGLLAAAADNRIKAYAGLAAAITNPSPVPDMPDLRIPIALLSGDQDGIVDYTTNSVPLYNAGVAPKLLPLITGGYHVGFQDDQYPIFPDSGSLPAAQQLAMTRSYLTNYFGLYLRDQQSYWRSIWGPEAFDQVGLPTIADPGVLVVPDMTAKFGDPGSTIDFNISITNTGPEANSFSLFTEDHNWNALLGTLQTPVLQPNETYHLNLGIQIPIFAGIGVTDLLLLSARSDNDGGTRGYTILFTTAIPEPSSALLSCLAVGGLMISRRRK